jgi:hypothetical protein
MAAIIEVKYFNSFFLNKTNSSDEPIWNGSRGIPEDIGGYPVVQNTNNTQDWVIEESRIRGGFNNTSTDYGAKAYLVEEQEAASFRVNSLIYSGIFNSRTGINNSNVFSIAEDITKSANPSNGSIQKLYAENSNLVIFQEQKVSRALINKDAIYNAEGGGSVTSSNLVIGVIQPYAGEYGISKNPESFAVYGYQKYFSDKNNNAILRLSKDGITEISSYGMKDFFRDKLNEIDSPSFSGIVIGGYDVHNSQYVVSMQTNPVFQQTDQQDTWNTLSFDEKISGWPSLYSYKPEQVFSIQNDFYTAYRGKLYRHYATVEPDAAATVVKRSNFYGIQYPSTISFVVNASPANSKSFQTIGYEGTSGWQVSSYTSDLTGEKKLNNSWSNSFDTTSGVKSYYEGEYVISESTGVSNQSSITNTINLSNVTGLIPVGALVTGAGIPQNTLVVSFSPSSSTVIVSQNVNVAQYVLLNFYIVVDRVSYNTAFNTTDPALPRYYAGFNLKENKYVANLLNASNPTEGEIVFGNQISGIKGFYANVKLSTDNTTNLGGEKQLFNASTTYTQNNGY